MLLWLIAPCLVSSQAPTAATVLPEHYRLLHVAPSEFAGRRQLVSALGFDHVAQDQVSGDLELTANDEQLAALDSSQVHYTIVIDDLASWYASRLVLAAQIPPQFGAWLSPSFAAGSLGGYYSYSEVASVLDQIHAAYPTLTTAKASIGTTVEGRAMWMIKLSDNPSVDENEPEVRVDAMHHAREPEGMQSSLWFMLYLLQSYSTDPLAKYLLDNREIYFIPVVNPDGYVYNQTTNPGGGGLWRKNRRDNGGGVFGVDLNRNYNDHWGWDNTGSSPTTSSETYRGPSAASEPEIQAMQAFIQSRGFQTALSLHTYSNLWLYPYGYAQIYPANNAQYVEVSNLATVINHYQVGPPAFILYLANGVTCDYEHDVKGTLAWTPEIGSSTDGFWPPTSRIVPLADENLLGLQRTALAAGAWLRVLSKSLAEVGDGDGFFEPGEGVDIATTVRNSGRAANSTAATLTLATSSPYASVTNGNYGFGALAPFTQATSSPLSLAIAANAPGGVSIDYTLTLTYEGWSQVENGTIPIGQPTPYLIDDAETDWGWTKGVAGDTAVSGLWTRGAPIGTSSSGQACSPSADDTPAPGTQCYVTGNGGGSAGTDDVDSGFTTLLSPVFDLSNCGPATLSYARWFADLTVADDAFVVSISNNGGQTWSPLESVSGNANAWTTVSFNVQSVLPQTSRMRLRFVASDAPNNSLVEAAVDDLRVQIYDSVPRLNIYGKPTLGSTVLANLTGTPGAPFVLRAAISSSTGGSTPPSTLANTQIVATGTIPATRLASVPITMPTRPGAVGHTFWLRALFGNGSGKPSSNWASVLVQ
jgi:hypothetical protein